MLFRSAGNLTFKSTATIVAKEGISMGAGAGAQKITTDGHRSHNTVNSIIDRSVSTYNHNGSITIISVNPCGYLVLAPHFDDVV